MNPQAQRHPVVADVREYARERAELSCLRTVAPEIRLGHTTLHNFLNGANPHPRVWRALRTWYEAKPLGTEGEPSRTDQLRAASARMRTLGARALPTLELVAILLDGNMPGMGSGLDASQNMLRELADTDGEALRRIMAAPLATVAALPGVGSTDRAAVLLAGLELGRRATEEGFAKSTHKLNGEDHPCV